MNPRNGRSSHAGRPEKVAIAPGPPPMIPPYPHETDFSVITVGTGTPMPSLERGSPSTMIQYRGKYLLVDMGDGTQHGLLKGEKGTFAARDIAALCFTHFHQDHTNGFFEIITSRWLAYGGELTIAGPPGAKALYEFLITFFKDDLAYRWLHEFERGLTGAGMFTDVHVKELTGSATFAIAGVEVTTAELTHTMYDLGYRFEAEGKSVVVSGDTTYDEKLVGLAKEADVLVMDADERWPGYLRHRIPTGSVLESRYRPSGRYGGDFEVRPHATVEEMAAMAGAAGVKHLVLTHLGGGEVDEESVREALRAGGFSGRVTFAVDGLEIPVEGRVTRRMAS